MSNPAQHYNSETKTDRLKVIDALRGVASLGVCLRHFICFGPNFWPNGCVKTVASYGNHGVDVFFVISGFVIPYSLHRSQYRFSDYGRFILKRIVRLDPPYIASILLVLSIGYAASIAPGFHGQPFGVDLTQLALHLGYLNVFFNRQWLNPVFWTLAIEVQYYLAVGLLFFLIASPSRLRRIATAVGLGVIAFECPNPAFLPCWLFIFMLGIAAFQLQTRVIDVAEFAIMITIFTIGTYYCNGPVFAVTALGTALLIGFFRSAIVWPLLFFGQISYSLYLVHLPVGGKVKNLLGRWAVSGSGKMAILAAALTTSIFVAWLFWRFIEQPALRWASKIRFKHPKTVIEVS